MGQKLSEAGAVWRGNGLSKAEQPVTVAGLELLELLHRADRHDASRPLWRIGGRYSGLLDKITG